MDIEALLEELNTFNEDEILYKNYYEYLKAGKTYQQLIDDMGVSYAFYRKHILPDVDGGFLPTVISDDNFFRGEDRNNIVITKHNRYTPVFSHKHLLFELIYVLSGSCIQQIEHKTITLTEGQFCLVAPGSVHSISVFDESIILNILIRRSTFEDIFYHILKDTNAISAFFNKTLYTKNQNAYLLIDSKKDPYIQNHVLSMLLEYREKKKYYEQILNGSITILFSKLLQRFEDTIYVSGDTRQAGNEFTDMLAYIDQNYQQITLHEVASHFHFSDAYCSRLIKKYTGKSFTELKQNIRFRMALFFLENTNKPIAEISSDIGFQNVEHFNRLFKKRFEITPGMYRKSKAPQSEPLAYREHTS